MFEIEDDLSKIIPKDEFAKALDAFMTKHHISVGKLAEICNEKMLYRSSCHRLRKDQLTTKYYLKVVPILEKKLAAWMVEKKWSPSQMDTELNKLFPHRKERTMIIPRTELIAPAIKFFGLTDDPFDVDRVPGANEFFTNNEIDQITSRVCDAVIYKRFFCVVGGVGTGKTSLKIRVHRELNNSKFKVHLIYPEFFDMNAVNVGSIASAVLQEFDVKVPRESTAKVSKIRRLLASMEKDDHRVALVFDECHRLNEKVLISLKNFWEMTNGMRARLLGIVLFGQPRFVEATLRDYKFREIAERVQVVEMPPLAKSAADYLAHKIECVGGDIHQLFEPEAIQRICSVAKTPLSLGNLANAALMRAYEIEMPQVKSRDLNLPDSPEYRLRRAA